MSLYPYARHATAFVLQQIEVTLREITEVVPQISTAKAGNSCEEGGAEIWNPARGEKIS